MHIKILRIIIRSESYSGIPQDFATNFNDNVEFINHYLSRHISKKKIENDHFTMLTVALENNVTEEYIDFSAKDKSVAVIIPFHEEDRSLYQDLHEKEKYGYILETIRKGYEIVAKEYGLPMAEAEDVFEEFAACNYTDRWTFKLAKGIDPVGTIKFVHEMNAWSYNLLMIYKGTDHKDKCDIIYSEHPSKICWGKSIRQLRVEKQAIKIVNFLEKETIAIPIPEYFRTAKYELFETKESQTSTKRAIDRLKKSIMHVDN